MMPLTCRNVDLARVGCDVISRGCPPNPCFGLKNNVKVARRDVALRVHSTKTPETLVNGAAQGPIPVLDLSKATDGPISLGSLFEVVADDLQTLNKNLQSIVGAENHVLMSAAKQIFGAGGKRLRPALVFLVSWATTELVGLKLLSLWLADEAVLPIENSFGGSIHRNYDLLLRHMLHIVGEVQLPASFSLLGLSGVGIDQLKRVMSHSKYNICTRQKPKQGDE